MEDAILIPALLFFLGGILGYQLGHYIGTLRVLKQWRDSLNDYE